MTPLRGCGEMVLETMPKTLFQKIWDSHVVAEQPDSPAILYIDLHLVHEVTSPQAFTGLRQRGLKVRRPDKTLATMDHSIPTTPIDVPIADAMALAQIKQMETNAAEFGITTGLECAPTAKGVLLRAPSWSVLAEGLAAAPRPKGSRLRVAVDPPRA